MKKKLSPYEATDVAAPSARMVADSCEKDDGTHGGIIPR
jgi:hypothetical protein